MKRSPFDIPLAKLSLAFDDQTHRLKRVRISYNDSKDYVRITSLNDEYVKITRTGKETTVYREPWERAWNITDFELEQLHGVVKTLIQTLDEFEHLLKKKRFDRCLYLDGFLPRFLRGFYYLHEAIRNHHDPLPRVTRVPERAFDVSLQSPKSDKRIGVWKDRPQHIMKLRISTKEFAFQLKEWEKQIARRSGKSYEDGGLFNTKLRKAYSLFVRIYFNLEPPPKVPTK